MMGKRRITAILLAAGNSTRFGGEGNKTLTHLGDKPVLAYSLEVLAQSPLVDEILVMARQQELPQAAQAIGSWAGGKSAVVLAGGESRQQSVLRGLEAASGEWVLIHDGARPFLQHRFIGDCLAALEQVPGAAVGVPAKDTVKVTDGEGLVVATTRRADTWLIQTPQAFHRAVLLECHRRFGHDPEITDDCMLLERGGIPVRILPGHQSNLKITTREDLALAAFYAAQGFAASPSQEGGSHGHEA